MIRAGTSDHCTLCDKAVRVTQLGTFFNHGRGGKGCPNSGRLSPAALAAQDERRSRRVAVVLEILRPHTVIARTLAPDIVDALDKLALETAREDIARESELTQETDPAAR